MSVRVLNEYMQFCKDYGFEPNLKDLKKFKELQ